jgi:hypothetical protein
MITSLTEKAQVRTSALVAREVAKVLAGQPSNCCLK